MKQPRESDLERGHWQSYGIDSVETLGRIKNLIIDAEGELEELNLEIAHTKSILDGLLVRHQMDTTRIFSLRYSISSIKRLPAEILGKIFVYCRKETWDEFPVILPARMSDYPWPLARVCSRWRRVLWNTPEVWSRIKFDTSSRPRYKSSNALHHILSCTSGLIDLFLPCDGYDKQIFNVVSCHPERFKGLRLRSTHLNQICTIATPFVSLDILNIIEENKYDWPSCVTLLAAPQLRTLSLHGLPQEISSLSPHFLPWSQLSELNLSSKAFIPRTIHSILSLCDSIVTCCVRITARTRSSATTHGDIVLYKLKSLSFMLNLDMYMSDTLFRPFVLPALEKLTINVTRFTPWPTGPIVKLIQRSHCHLTKVKFSRDTERRCQSMPREPIDMLSLFQVTPLLVEFKASGFVVPPSTFEHALPHGLVPHIKYLECYVLSEGLDAFLDLMEYYSKGRGDSQGPLTVCGIQFAYIRCLEDPGSKEAFGRFKNLVPKYKVDGRNTMVKCYDL